jgi:energy-coupling factor transporter ATP-binding protein EcfA2
MSNHSISDFDSPSKEAKKTKPDHFMLTTLKRPQRKATTINESFAEKADNQLDNTLVEEEYEEFDTNSILADFQHVAPKKRANIPPTAPPVMPSENKSILDGLPRIPITIGKKRKERKVLRKEHTSLQAKNSNFIFVFGYTGSGKTTVLAAIDLYIRRKYAKTVNPTGNKIGINHINKIVRNITFGEFPNATPAGTIVEYDVALTHPVTDETVNLTFIEMAGEDLRKINTDDEDSGNGDLRSEIKKYLTCPDISISFLLIADYKERVASLREDDLFMNFFGYVRNLEIPLKNVGVVVSKFDREQTDRLFLNDVVDNYLPQTRLFMENRSIIENAKIFPFSIGHVMEEEGEEPRILAIDLRDTDAIVNWLFDSFSEFGEADNSWSWKKMLGW